MWKVQVCCCFEDFEQRRCFPWYSVSKSTHWHLPEKGKTKSALSSSFPSSAPKRNEKRLLGPCCPRANDCTMLQEPPWLPAATLSTQSVARGRRKGHVVCTFGLLTTTTGLEKLFFWEFVVHLAFKNLLCFLFFSSSISWRIREKQTFHSGDCHGFFLRCATEWQQGSSKRRDLFINVSGNILKIKKCQKWGWVTAKSWEGRCVFWKGGINNLPVVVLK